MTQLTERAWPAVIVFDLPETQEVVGWIVWVDGGR